MNLEKANPALFAALAKAQGAVENATKNAANPHFKSRYADLAEVLNTVRPVFAEHGLSITQSTEFDGQHVRVTTCLGHAEGGFVTTTAACVPGKTDAQGIGSATTYLRRYGLAAIAGVAQEDDDGESAAQRPHNAHGAAPVAAAKPTEPPRLTDEQLAELRDLMRSTKTAEADFVKWIGASDLEHCDYRRAKNALEKKAMKTQDKAA